MAIEKKYRVRLSRGIYYIETEHVQINSIGSLWWKREHITRSWIRCDDSGYGISHGACLRFRFYTTPLDGFDNLKDAMDKITELIKPNQIFEYRTDYEGMKKPLTTF